MHKNIKKRQSGFTIIEVLIVLAIAGLIMLIIFLAVPALQRNNRNTQRNADVSRMAGLINDYVSGHGGTLPTAIGTGTGSGVLDVSNEKWSQMNAPVTADIITASTWGTISGMKINKGFKCDTQNNTLTPSSARTFAITYQKEASGNDQNACITG